MLRASSPLSSNVLDDIDYSDLPELEDVDSSDLEDMVRLPLLHPCLLSLSLLHR